MNKAVQRYLEVATGLTNVTKAKAEQIAKQLVKQGEAAGDQVGDLVDQMMERQRKNREAVSSIVQKETERAVNAMGFARRRDVERLEKEVAELKKQVKASSGTKRATKKSAAKRSTSKKSTAKKSGTKKAAAKKSSSKASGSGS